MADLHGLHEVREQVLVAPLQVVALTKHVDGWERDRRPEGSCVLCVTRPEARDEDHALERRHSRQRVARLLQPCEHGGDARSLCIVIASLQGPQGCKRSTLLCT